MNTKIHFIIAAFLSGIVFQPSFARAQGVLNPSGAPMPSMKSLDQIEARMPISYAPFTISLSGSYYLTTNLTVSAGSAITISANNVCLDLNGFTLSSTENPAMTNCGILLYGSGDGSGDTNITIVNGFINSGVTNDSNGNFNGSGFGSGIYGGSSINMRVSGVSVSGCRLYGIFLGGSSVVESCTVNTAGTYGILGYSVTDSSAVNCGFCGIDAVTANNCFGSASVTGGYGILANAAANNCFGSSYNGFGLGATTANNCLGVDNGSTPGLGIGVNAQIAIGCEGAGGEYGVESIIANSCISDTGDSAITYKYNMP